MGLDFGAELDFAEVVGANQSLVFSLALRFLRDRAIAEELAQDVFLQLYREFGRIHSGAHATWWLRRAICHRSIDASRRRQLRPSVGLEEAPEPRMESDEADVLLHEHLRRLVGNLPERARTVVLLRYQEDLDPTEIAEMLGIPVSTVKSHLHRSLVLLRGQPQGKEARKVS